MEGKGWVSAGELKVGDKLLLYSNDIVEVTNLELVHINNPIKVYNFEVEDWHTYFVSGASVLVHNMCAKQVNGIGGKGWRGDKAWRANVNRVKAGGNINKVNGTIATQQEAIDLIKESGGKIVRIEGAHPIGGISNHTYPHINYTTSSGIKGTIRILHIMNITGKK